MVNPKEVMSRRTFLKLSAFSGGAAALAACAPIEQPISPTTAPDIAPTTAPTIAPTVAPAIPDTAVPPTVAGPIPTEVVDNIGFPDSLSFDEINNLRGKAVDVTDQADFRNISNVQTVFNLAQRWMAASNSDSVSGAELRIKFWQESQRIDIVLEKDGKTAGWLKVTDPISQKAYFADRPSWNTAPGFSPNVDQAKFELPPVLKTTNYFETILWQGDKVILVEIDSVTNLPVRWLDVRATERRMRGVIGSAGEALENIRQELDPERFVTDENAMPEPIRKIYEDENTPKNHLTTWGEMTIAAYDKSLNRIVYVANGNDVVAFINSGENKINELPEGILYCFGSNGIYVLHTNPTQFGYYARSEYGKGKEDPSGRIRYAALMREDLYILSRAVANLPIAADDATQLEMQKPMYFIDGDGRTFFENPGVNTFDYTYKYKDGRTLKGTIDMGRPFIIFFDPELDDWRPAFTSTPDGINVFHVGKAGKEWTPDSPVTGSMAVIEIDLDKNYNKLYIKHISTFSSGKFVVKKGQTNLRLNLRYIPRPNDLYEPGD